MASGTTEFATGRHGGLWENGGLHMQLVVVDVVVVPLCPADDGAPVFGFG